jgi:serine/threonine protein kinase
LGCILYELAVKRKAFTDDWVVREYADRKQKLFVPSEYFANEIQIPLTNLIHEMLQVNPRERPSAKELHVVLMSLASMPTPIFDTKSPLFCKIYRPLSDAVAQSSV